MCLGRFIDRLEMNSARLYQWHVMNYEVFEELQEIIKDAYEGLGTDYEKQVVTERLMEVVNEFYGTGA